MDYCNYSSVWKGFETINEKEAIELKKIYDHYLDKRSNLGKSNQFSFEDVLGDILIEYSVSREQITHPISFVAKIS